MSEPPPSRPLTVVTATGLVVASMVGTGVFVTSGILLAELRAPHLVLAAWALGGVLALCGALSYAELVAALPMNGGEYALISRTLHPALGFAAGVVSWVVGFSAPLAAIALAFGSYAERAGLPLAPRVSAMVAIVVFTVLQAGDVRRSGRLQDALTLGKLLLIVGFAVAGAVVLAETGGELPRWTTDGPPVWSPAFAVAVTTVTFSYTGWNAAAYIAGELRDPGRSAPLALAVGTGLVLVLYLALNFVFLAAAPAEALGENITIAHTAAVALFGEPAARTLSAIISVSLLATLGAITMTGVRVLEAMGRDHHALRFLARGESPVSRAALLLQNGLAFVLAATGRIEGLLLYMGMTLTLVSGLTLLGVFALRWREPDRPRPYRVPLYPLTPLVALAITAWVVIDTVRAEPIAGWAGALTVLGGIAGYAVLRRFEPA